MSFGGWLFGEEKFENRERTVESTLVPGLVPRLVGLSFLMVSLVAFAAMRDAIHRQTGPIAVGIVVVLIGGLAIAFLLTGLNGLLTHGWTLDGDKRELRRWVRIGVRFPYGKVRLRDANDVRLLESPAGAVMLRTRWALEVAGEGTSMVVARARRREHLERAYEAMRARLK